MINLLCHVYDIFMTDCVFLVMSNCFDKDTAGYDPLVYVKVSLPKHLKLVYGILVYVKLS